MLRNTDRYTITVSLSTQTYKILNKEAIDLGISNSANVRNALELLTNTKGSFDERYSEPIVDTYTKPVVKNADSIPYGETITIGDTILLKLVYEGMVYKLKNIDIDKILKNAAKGPVPMRWRSHVSWETPYNEWFEMLIDRLIKMNAKAVKSPMDILNDMCPD